MWRKNRVKNSGSSCRGVDLNRNFGFHWAGKLSYISITEKSSEMIEDNNYEIERARKSVEKLRGKNIFMRKLWSQKIILNKLWSFSKDTKKIFNLVVNHFKQPQNLRVAGNLKYKYLENTDLQAKVTTKK